MSVALSTHARKLGTRIPVSPEDIPGVGRFAILVLEDLTGAVYLAMPT
jgi:hypothetical protein